jgi:hypothetical protein
MRRADQLIEEDAFKLLNALVIVFIHRFSFSIALARKQTISLSDICRYRN